MVIYVIKKGLRADLQVQYGWKKNYLIKLYLGKKEKMLMN